MPAKYTDGAARTDHVGKCDTARDRDALSDYRDALSDYSLRRLHKEDRMRLLVRIAHILVWVPSTLVFSTSIATAQDQPKATTCRVVLESVKLVLSKSDKYARADYVISDDCVPIIRSVLYSSDVPQDAAATIAQAGAPNKTAAAEGTLVVPSPTQSIPAQSRGRACMVEVLEDDVVAVTMITLRNSTSWETEDGKIVSARVQGVAFANLDWWFVNGKPAVPIGYVREPYTAASSAIAEYHCNGAGPLARYVCNGPSFRITLQGDISFDGGGNCSGQARYSGTVVPGGRVRFDVRRN
jgi:hypothetical protein